MSMPIIASRQFIVSKTQDESSGDSRADPLSAWQSRIVTVGLHRYGDVTQPTNSQRHAVGRS